MRIEPNYLYRVMPQARRGRAGQARRPGLAPGVSPGSTSSLARRAARTRVGSPTLRRRPRLATAASPLVAKSDPSCLTASRSSASSLTVTSMRDREKSLDLESLNDLVRTARAGDRKARDQPLRHAVGTIRRDRHRYPVAVRRAQDPVVDVVDRGVGGRRRARGAARLDDRRAALLHGRDEVVLEPLLVVRSPRRRSSRSPSRGRCRGTGWRSDCPRSSRW